jgi:hypothetical protein
MAVVIFFVFAAILMPVWNYTMPKIIGSIDSTYDETTFQTINYEVAMVTTILIGLLFSAPIFGSTINDSVDFSRAYMSDQITNLKKTNTKNSKKTSKAYDFDYEDL